MPFVLAGVGVKNDDAMVAVTIGDVDLIRCLVDKSLGRQAEVFDIIAAFALTRFSDLHDELSALGKLQHHAVVKIAAHTANLAFVELTRSLSRTAARRT